ncbi:MAG: type 1 fimbrial protein [Achromobacter xylosoxidans]|nr:type 1 fimbrial protein [Achromobacter xylosoxidans]
MFKKTLLATAATAATAVLLGPMTASAASNLGALTFAGEVLDAPCSVAGPDLFQTVQLGQISAKSLRGTKGTAGPTVPVEIHLKDCSFDANTGTDKATKPFLLNKVSVQFRGQTATDGILAGSNPYDAEGVSVQLLGRDGITPINFATAGDTVSQITAANGVENVIVLNARMVNNGVTPVKAGKLAAVASYEVIYK